MTRGSIRKSVDRSRAKGYLDVAENFFRAAGMAREFEYWNAAGVLIVHAAIAFADALTIRFGAVKSQGEDHHDTIALLAELLSPSEPTTRALNHLRRIIDQKTAVSYAGEAYTRTDVDALWKSMDRFRRWALDATSQ